MRKMPDAGENPPYDVIPSKNLTVLKLETKIRRWSSLRRGAHERIN